MGGPLFAAELLAAGRVCALHGEIVEELADGPGWGCAGVDVMERGAVDGAEGGVVEGAGEAGAAEEVLALRGLDGVAQWASAGAGERG